MAEDDLAEFDAAITRLAQVQDEIAKRVIGQQQVVRQTIASMLSGGHTLLVGVPGLAKTRLVETLATVFGLHSNRIQFTPDLMPADILGAEVLETGADGSRAFRFVEGPIFCQLLMADEINRASPRTQSALLQAMQEHHVSVAGQRRDLPRPFQVLATQNPLETEGTYPLPEAQLDRFLMQVSVDYPDRAAEKAILLATTGVDEQSVEPVLDAEALIAMQRLVRRMPIGDAVVEAILTLVRSARPDADAPDYIREAVAWGPGPRAAQALMLAVRAKALLDGRPAPMLRDVAELALPVLQHRMALGFHARADGVRLPDVIARLTVDVIGLTEAH